MQIQHFFFHRKLKFHSAHRKILTLTDSRGIKLTNYEDVKAEAVRYYQTLFRNQRPYSNNLEARLSSIIQNKLTAEQGCSLIKDITNAEVHQHSSMRERAAPGPKGYTVEFLKRNYSLVGQDVINVVRYY